mmetsp:Transcript_7085/g.15253  ORF Transcript_7085/g.15253 Transcript_7085/m.15253 type:complete len:320 (-) Transcript_7085:1-960(-)
MGQAEAADPVEHALHRLRSAILLHLFGVNMLCHVFRHLLPAFLYGPLVPEVPPVAHQEIKGLEGLSGIGLCLWSVAPIGLATGAPKRSLGESHEVGEVLDLVLLELHGIVVDLLGRQHRSEPKHRGGLLLSHVAIPGALRVHEDDSSRSALDLSEEGLRPDPDALGARVHAALEAEAIQIVVARALNLISGRKQPGRNGVVLATTSGRRVFRRRVYVLAILAAAILIAKVAQKEVQEEGLPSPKCAHDRYNRDVSDTDGFEVLLKPSKRVLIHNNLAMLHVELDELQGASFLRRYLRSHGPGLLHRPRTTAVSKRGPKS